MSRFPQSWKELKNSLFWCKNRQKVYYNCVFVLKLIIFVVLAYWESRFPSKSNKVDYKTTPPNKKIKKADKITIEIHAFQSILGSGCGSVGRAVTSDSRGPRFESSLWQNLWWTFTYSQMYWKDDNIEKRGREWPIFKLEFLSKYSHLIIRVSLPIALKVAIAL